MAWSFFSSSSSSSSQQAQDAAQTAGAALGIETSNDSCFPSMSYETRMYGFIGSFLVGWVLSAFSILALSMANITMFVIMYTFGNITTLFSMMFLMGPMRQLRGMFDPVRIGATLIFFTTLILTLVVALTTKNVLGAVLCVIAQFFASLWYALSYIPGARNAVVACCCPSALGGVTVG